MQETFRRALFDAESALNAFRTKQANIEALEQAAGAVASCFRRRGRVFACGNGGSMADALHFAEEWTGRFKKDRIPYPALALGESTHLSCVGNDYGFEHIFSRQVQAFGHEGDILILLTTSGNSKNLTLAAEAAKELGVFVVGFTGRGGGKLAVLCDLLIDVPGETSDRIQEIHMVALHALIEAVEIDLGHGDTSA